MDVSIRHIGVATVVISLNGTTVINDPCFDEAGSWYHHGFGAFSRKTKDPELSPDELSRVPDIGLVTHGHHRDNLDSRGRKYLTNVDTVISTVYSSDKVPGAVGLESGEKHRPDQVDSDLTIHAVSAQHGVSLLSTLSGPVNGYVLEFESADTRLYVSGDTIYNERITAAVRSLGQIDLFVPHLGNAYFPYLSGPLRYTMNASDLKYFLTDLEPRFTYPVHNEGWTHFRPVDLSSFTRGTARSKFLTVRKCEVTL
ncbi:MAG: MBL fold metallo-hydrolase [bacterium]